MRRLTYPYLVRFIAGLALTYYRYFPRFMTGICLVSFTTNGTRFRLLTGKVIYPKYQSNFIAEVHFLNVFGSVLFPTIKAIFRK